MTFCSFFAKERDSGSLFAIFIYNQVPHITSEARKAGQKYVVIYQNMYNAHGRKTNVLCVTNCKCKSRFPNDVVISTITSHLKGGNWQTFSLLSRYIYIYVYIYICMCNFRLISEINSFAVVCIWDCKQNGFMNDHISVHLLLHYLLPTFFPVGCCIYIYIYIYIVLVYRF